MNFLTTSTFEKTLKKLHKNEQAEVKKAVADLTYFFESGKRSDGLGLKCLRKPIWEIRASIRTRILFSFVENDITFLIIGSHDEVKSFLKKL